MTFKSRSFRTENMHGNIRLRKQCIDMLLLNDYQYTSNEVRRSLIGRRIDDTLPAEARRASQRTFRFGSDNDFHSFTAKCPCNREGSSLISVSDQHSHWCPRSTLTF